MTEEYEVGYRKPPKRTQFQRGQSGNPKGRPAESRNLKTDLQDELEELILIREGKNQKTITKRRAMLKGLMSRAMKGDSRAANLILGMVFRFLEPDAPQDEEDMTPEERSILAEFEEDVARRIRDRKPATRTRKPKRKTGRSKDTAKTKSRRR